MSTRPQLQTIDQLPACTVATEQALVVLLENGPDFSALIAKRVSNEPDDGAIVLEDCHQFRIFKSGSCRLQKFNTVSISRDPETDYWIAAPSKLRTLFSQPSLAPYSIIQLDELASDTLMKALENDDDEFAFGMIRTRFASLPKFFSQSPTELETPDNYASGAKLYRGKWRLI